MGQCQTQGSEAESPQQPINTRTHTELLTLTINFILRKVKTFDRNGGTNVAKLTQAEIKAKADEYIRLQTEIAEVQRKRERVVNPLMERHALEMASATRKYDTQIDKLNNAGTELYHEVMDWLESQSKPVKLVGELAIAQLQITEIAKAGPRVIDVERFIALAKEQKKDPWSCIKAEVGKAEKLLGPKDIEKVSTRETKTVESRSAFIEAI